MPNVKPIPDGYHTVTPYLVQEDADAAIAFYKEAFGAEEIYRMPSPDGRLMHAEIRIGDSIIMLSSEFPEMGGTARSPKSAGCHTGSLLILTEDADAAFKRAIDAGATSVMPLENMFWGDRYGKVKDPFGHEWQIATHIEDVSPEEMQKRVEAVMAAS